jgi:dTDP-4-dehydrorhamnose reductase
MRAGRLRRGTFNSPTPFVFLNRKPKQVQPEFHLNCKPTRVPFAGAAGPAPLEVWGGIECSIVRVRDSYRNQLFETGHATRRGDLERIRALGIRMLRYPVLWEMVAPDHPDERDWSWPDARLAELRNLGITPIITLLHHGSGPRYTSLSDPRFPALLGSFARAVAERYPWAEFYTPINEPLTTARFSGLYGHWYPHGRSYEVFLPAFVNQCSAIAEAMSSIRSVSPTAQLVQTEDLGKTFSTPRLAYQAEHENSRRWLTFDMLCGMVDRTHDWWQVFRVHGISERVLASFLDGRSAPDILGFDHYLTSERFLDERSSMYPRCFLGGNGTHRYADVEAVRMPIEGTGPRHRLWEAWLRYKRPMAVMEVHHGGPPAEQLRWMYAVWSAAVEIKAAGADLKAVTVWALLGMYDWRSLMCRNEGCYEPGAYDTRGEELELTALGRATVSLCRDRGFDHDALHEEAWWESPSRFYDTALHREPVPAD